MSEERLLPQPLLNGGLPLLGPIGQRLTRARKLETGLHSEFHCLMPWQCTGREQRILPALGMLV